jgi:hypothetical protein
MAKNAFLVIGLLITAAVFGINNQGITEDQTLVTLKAGILDIDKLMAKTKSTERAMKKILSQYAPEEKTLEKEETFFTRRY